jgi:hypothetical protein
MNTGQSYGQNTSDATAFNRGESFGQNTGLQSSVSRQDVYAPQEDALRGLYGAASGLLAGGERAGGADAIAQSARNAWQQSLTPGGNPYFERNVQGAIDQAARGFRESVVPELDARGVAAGQYGGTRDSLARGQAAGQFGQGLAQMTGQMYADQYGADQQMRSAALGQTGAMQGAQFAPLREAQGLVGGPTVLGQGSSIGTTQGTQGSSTVGESISRAQGSQGASNYGRSSGGSQASSDSWQQAITDAFSRSGSGSRAWNANASVGQK